MSIELFIPFITAAVQMFKGLGLPAKFAPLAAIALGIGLSLSQGVIVLETILMGILYGFSAVGLFAAGKTAGKFIKK